MVEPSSVPAYRLSLLSLCGSCGIGIDDVVYVSQQCPREWDCITEYSLVECFQLCYPLQNREHSLLLFCAKLRGSLSSSISPVHAGYIQYIREIHQSPSL